MLGEGHRKRHGYFHCNPGLHRSSTRRHCVPLSTTHARSHLHGDTTCWVDVYETMGASCGNVTDSIKPGPMGRPMHCVPRCVVSLQKSIDIASQAATQNPIADAGYNTWWVQQKTDQNQCCPTLASQLADSALPIQDNVSRGQLLVSSRSLPPEDLDLQRTVLGCSHSARHVNTTQEPALSPRNKI